MFILTQEEKSSLVKSFNVKVIYETSTGKLNQGSQKQCKTKFVENFSVKEK